MNFEPHVQMAQPALVGWLSGTQSLTDDDVAEIGEGMGYAVSWMDQRDSFAARPGALAGARLRALDYADPEIRASALRFIDAIRTMPEDRQQAFAAIARGSGGPAPQGLAEIQTLAKEQAEGLEVALSAASAAGVEAGVEEGTLVLEGTEEAVDLKAALGATFPELEVLIGGNFGFGDEFREILNDVAHGPERAALYVYERSEAARRLTDIFAETVEGRRRVEVAPGEFEYRDTSIPGAILPFVASAAQAGWDAAFSGANDLLRETPFYSVADDFSTGSRGLTATAAPIVVKAIGAGLDPEDPDYQWKLEQRAGAFTILLMGLSVPGSALLRRVKLVRQVPGRTAAEVVLKAMRSEPRSALLGKAAEVFKLPLREVTKLVDQQLVKLARDPEKWWNSGIRSNNGAALVEVLEEAQSVYPGDLESQVGFVVHGYGTTAMSVDLAERMLRQITPEGMRRAFVDFLSEPIRDRGTLWRQRNEVASQLAGMERPAAVSSPAIDSQLQGLIDALDISPEYRAMVDEFADVETLDPKWAELIGDEEAYRVARLESIDSWSRTHLSEDPRFLEWEQRSRHLRETVEDEAALLAQLDELAQKIAEAGGRDPIAPGAYSFLPAKDAIEILGGATLDAEMDAMDLAIRRSLGIPEDAEIGPGVVLDLSGEAPRMVADWQRFRMRPASIEIDVSFEELNRFGVDPNYVYHVSDYDRAAAIQRAGLDPQLPGTRTMAASGAWEDGGTDPRLFFGSSPADAAARAGGVVPGVAGEGLDLTRRKMALFRVRREVVELKTMRTETFEDLYTSGKVEPGTVEVLGEDGQWHRGAELAGPSPEVAAAYDRLRLELDSLDQQLAAPSPRGRPMLRYPKRNAVRFAVQAPMGRTGRLLSFFSLNKLSAKIVEELGRFPELYVPGSSGRLAPDWLERNIDVLSRYMRRAGVPTEKIHLRIGQMAGVKNQRAFFELVENRVFGEGGDIDLALKPGTDPRLRQRIINLHDNPIEGRTSSWVHEDAVSPDGGTVRIRRPALARQIRPGEEVPVPSSPTEFLETLRLPDVELLIDADSALRRLVSRVEKSGVPGRLAAGVLYEVPKAILDLSTAVLKPLVMLVRLPAMAIRIQMEQALRASAFGYRPFRGIPDGISIFPGGIPIPMTKVRLLQSVFGEEGWPLLAPDQRLKGFMDPEAAEAGMFMTEVMEGETPVHAPRSTVEFRTGRRAPKGEDLEGWRQGLGRLHNDFLLHEIVVQNFDRDSVLAWLSTEERAGRYMTELQQPELDALGVSREWWLDRKIEQVRQYTHDNPELLEIVATGQYREFGGIDPDLLPNGRPAAERYNELAELRDALNAELKFRNRNGFPEGADAGYDLGENAAEMAALADVRRDTLREMASIREEYGDIARSQRSIDLGDKKAMRRALNKRWQAQEWEMPETLTVEQPLRAHHYDGGVFDDIRRYGTAITRAMYRPFKILSWVDRKGTRGSLFTQAYLRNLAELKARGYSAVEAKAYARAYAGEVTRDIMYDLTARTSAQRALRNIFWFAPAWQEVLYTWLVKIPSLSYWPVGAAALVGKYALAKELLQEIGIVQQNADGEDIIVLPEVFGGLVEKFTGLKVPPVVYGKLSGLNLVTTAGGVPGLSTPGNFTLGKAALRYGGVFKALSDLFQPYGPETSLLPAPMVYLHEAVFGEAPLFDLMSPELVKSRWDQAFNGGLQYAFAELEHAGIRQPRAEDYGRLEADGTWTLSQEQEAAYKLASDRYAHMFFDLGERYARGIAWVKLLGGTLSPMSLYPTSEEREEWRKFWDTMIAPEGFGSEGLSDHQKELISTYLAKHPESVGYSVFYSEYGEKQRSLPFGETLDDKFYDDYLTGEKKTMEPLDFSKKLMYIESIRHYQSRTDAILDQISPGRDPWELLTMGFARSAAVQAEKEAIDRYLYLNQEIESVILRTREGWIDAHNVPVRSFEAERLGNTIDSIRQLSPMLTGESAFRPDEVKVILADLQEMYSDHGDEFGEPNTPTEKAMAWWVDSVLAPYLEKTTALYAEAQDLEGRGLSPSPVYNLIRTFSNATPPKYKGKEVPSVERVFFGNKGPEEQAATVLKWRTRPLSWLSDFQLDAVGSYSPEVKDFLGMVSAFDDTFWLRINQSGLSSSSDAYQRLLAARSAELQREAAEVGPEAVEALRLSEAAPVVRLTEGGFGGNSQLWQSTARGASEIAGGLRAAGLSPRGFSESALRAKSALYAAIESVRERDAGYDELWTRLSDIMRLRNGVPREGALLYEAILFGNFNESVPYQLAVIGG